MIDRATIDEIMSTARVEDVVGDYVNLKRRGANMLGLCPFHNEKTPSFTVSPAKNLYKCFGCGQGGGAVNFLMEHESFTYPEALRHLAKRYNIKIEEKEETDEQKEAQRVKESLLIINEMAADFFKDKLNNTEEGRAVGLSYFKHRGLLEATIKQFDLGYSPKEYKVFLEYALNKGYKEELLKQLGLVSTNGYDFFRERVIFPFHNLSGKVIGFGGRILKDNVKSPKYLNSPESELYNKRKTLYGLYQAKSEIRKKGVCVLVEGYTDVLSLHQNEIRNAVASSGTSLTSEQVRLIKRFADEVLVLYDGDAAGQKAALRGLNIFLEYDMNVKLVTLPEGHDPDSYVRELGSTGFSAYLEEEGKDFVLKLARNIEDEYAKDPVQKSVAIRELTESIALIANQIKRSLYVKECANILSIDESALFQEINKVIRKKIQQKNNSRSRDYAVAQPSVKEPHVDTRPEQDHSQGIHKITDKTDYQEKKLVEVLVAFGHKLMIPESRQEVDVVSEMENMREHIKDELHIKIVDQFLAEIKKELTIQSTFWTNHQDDDLRKFAVNVVQDKYVYANWSGKGLELQTQKPVEDNYVRDFIEAATRFMSRRIHERIKEFDELIRNSDDENNIVVFLTARKEYENLRKELMIRYGQIVL